VKLFKGDERICARGYPARTSRRRLPGINHRKSAIINAAVMWIDPSAAITIRSRMRIRACSLSAAGSARNSTFDVVATRNRSRLNHASVKSRRLFVTIFARSSRKLHPSNKDAVLPLPLSLSLSDSPVSLGALASQLISRRDLFVKIAVTGTLCLYGRAEQPRFSA